MPEIPGPWRAGGPLPTRAEFNALKGLIEAAGRARANGNVAGYAGPSGSARRTPGDDSFLARLAGTANPYTWTEVGPDGAALTAGRSGTQAYDVNHGLGLGGLVVRLHPTAWDYRFAIPRKPAPCVPCVLPGRDLSLSISFYSSAKFDSSGNPIPPVTQTYSTTLTLSAGTDSYLALADDPTAGRVLGAPHAYDGRVWRTPCLRFRSIDNQSIAGTKGSPCTPYFGGFDTYQDYLFELFCDGSYVHFLMYEVVAGVNIDCTAPGPACGVLDEGRLSAASCGGNRGTLEQLHTSSGTPYLNWNTSRHPFGLVGHDCAAFSLEFAPSGGPWYQMYNDAVIT